MIGFSARETDREMHSEVGRDLEFGSLFLLGALERGSLAGSLDKKESQLVAFWPL